MPSEPQWGQMSKLKKNNKRKAYSLSHFDPTTVIGMRNVQSYLLLKKKAVWGFTKPCKGERT